MRKKVIPKKIEKLHPLSCGRIDLLEDKRCGEVVDGYPLFCQDCYEKKGDKIKKLKKYSWFRCEKKVQT